MSAECVTISNSRGDFYAIQNWLKFVAAVNWLSTNCGLPSVKVSFRLAVLLRKSTYHFITSLCCGGILQNELYFKKLSPERVSNSCEFCFAVENLTCYNYANVFSLPTTFALMWMLRFCRDSCFFFDGERETRNESCDVGFLKSGQLNFLFFFLSIEYKGYRLYCVVNNCHNTSNGGFLFNLSVNWEICFGLVWLN